MAELENKEIVGMQDDPAIMIGEVPDVVSPQSLEDAIALEATPAIDYDAFKSTETEDVGFEPEDFDKSERSTFQKYAEVMNAYGQQFMDDTLVGHRPTEEERNWDSSNDKWYDSLKPEQKVLVYDAPTREYAELKLRRQASYHAAEIAIKDDSLWTAIPMGLATGILTPDVLVGGFVFRGVKTAYTVGDKLMKLSKVVGSSAAIAAAGATLDESVFAGTGSRQADYLQANLWAVGIGGGLPMLSKALGSSYDVGTTAKALASSPKEFAVLTGELAMNKLGVSARNTSMYAKLMPDWAQSDVFVTSASKNSDIVNVSSRIDAPSVAMTDTATGKPVANKGNMQDYKTRMYGEFNLYKTDMKELRIEAAHNGWVTNKVQFDDEVGRLVRERANKQEMLVHSEMDVRTEKLRIDLESDLAWKVKEAVDAQVATVRNQMKPKDLEKHVADITKEHTKTLKKEMEVTLKEAKLKIKNDLYDEIQLDFNTKNAGLRKAAQKVSDHYDDIREKGVKLGSSELADIPKGRYYMTRIFALDKVHDLEVHEIATILRRGLAGHPANSSKKITSEHLDKMSNDMATTLKGLEYDKSFIDNSFLVPKELGMNQFLKSRKYKLDESQLGDLLQSNMEEVMGQYTYKISGQLSALRAFPEALKDVPLAQQTQAFREKFIKPLRDNAVATGTRLKKSEIEGLERMFSDALGTFRMQSNGRSGSAQAYRLLNGWNSLTYGGGFGLNTFSEMGTLLMGGNIRNLAKARLAPMKEIATMFNSKGVKDPMVRDFILAGQMDQLFEHKGMMRMADTEGLFNVGKLEKGMNSANDLLYKVNMLRPLTTALEMIAAPKLVHDVLDMGSKGRLKLKDEKFLARVGLTVKDAQDINNLMRKHGKFDRAGRITDMGLNEWADSELADTLVTAIGRGVKHAIIKGDTTYLPHWMIDPNRPVVRLMTTFLRFPIAATETLMVRGINEDAAQWASATAVSTMAFASVMYLREQAALAVGAIDEADAKYADAFEDREVMGDLLFKSLMRAGPLGGGTIVTERGLNMFGISTPGTEYVGSTLDVAAGPTLGRLNQWQDILSAAAEGNFHDKASWYATKSMLPFASMPILNEYLGYLIRHNSY